LAGDYDEFTPPPGLDRIDTSPRAAYTKAGRPEAWQLRRYPSGHYEIAVMRVEVLGFLGEWF